MRGGHFWASRCTAKSQGADRRHCNRWRLSFSSGYITPEDFNCVNCHLLVSMSKTTRIAMLFFFQPMIERFATEGNTWAAESRILFGLQNSCRLPVWWRPRRPSTGLQSGRTSRNTKSSNGRVSHSVVYVCYGAERRLTNLDQAGNLIDFILVKRLQGFHVARILQQ